MWHEWVKLNGGGGGKQRGGGKNGPKSKKKKKAANGPKKNLSAYLLFCRSERDKKNLSGTVREQGSELGRRWKVLNAEMKQSFIQQAAVEKC